VVVVTGRELIESIVWAHNKLKVAPAIQPQYFSIHKVVLLVLPTTYSVVLQQLGAFFEAIISVG
jgi:photosystem I P700 chlorophyll a apoprotein A1